MDDELTMKQALTRGVVDLGLQLPSGNEQQLLAYLRLLRKWNKVYNLTAICEPSQMVTHHLLDSLAIVPFVHGQRLLDVGSGAGLPGMVIAIAKPDLHCTLLDSNGKKIRFLTQVVIDLKLANVEVVQGRAEQYHPREPFDCIVARAFADLAALLNLVRPLLATDGELLAMKSVRADLEIELAPSGWELQTHRLEVPGLEAERSLILARRSA